MSESEKQMESHVTVMSEGISAIEALEEVTGLPRQRIKYAMTQGAVWLTRKKNTKRLRRAKRVLQVGDEIHLYYDAEILAEVPPVPTLLADVGGYSVWRKPYGLRSQGSKWGDHCTVVRWAEQNLTPERNAFTVHRLDRAANGLILIAHAKKIAANLSAQFANRAVRKDYLAVVSGDISSEPDPRKVDQAIDGKEAGSEFSLLRVSDDKNQSLLRVCIATGRKHQIRRHLASIGYPVIGDRLYGDGEKDNVDLQLTACRLAFHCPVNDAPVEYQLDKEWLPEFQGFSW